MSLINYCKSNGFTLIISLYKLITNIHFYYTNDSIIKESLSLSITKKTY